MSETSGPGVPDSGARTADRLASTRARVATAARRLPGVRTLTARTRRQPAQPPRSRRLPTQWRRSKAEVNRLRELLPQLRDPADDAPETELRTEVRQLATKTHIGDRDGLAIDALRLLADDHQDRGAGAWLAPVLAHAGRFEEAVDTGVSFAPGRPPARAYLVLVTALQQSGRPEQAAELMGSLRSRFPGLAEHCVDIWSQDPSGPAYRRLYDASPAHDGMLPVFQHLPFSAGTSMQVALKQVVPWARTLQISRHWGLLEIERALGYSAEDAAQLMLVRQHHPYPLEIGGRKLRHVTVLRDPVSQIRSGFYKRQQRVGIIGTRDTESQSFADHVEFRLQHGLTNLLSRMLATTHPDLRRPYRKHFSTSEDYTRIGFEEDMFWVEATRKLTEDRLLALCRETLEENFPVVGTMAQLEASHLACTAAVGVPVAPRLTHRGKSGRPDQGEDGALERRLRDANGVDQQLYEEYTARFERDHAGLIEAVAAAPPTGGSA